MAVIEVPMISGFQADVESVERVGNYINMPTQTLPGLDIVQYIIVNIHRSIDSRADRDKRINIHIFNKKHYVTAFVRLILFSLETPDSHVHRHGMPP